MNHRSDIDRTLTIWMADGPTTMPDRVVDVVAARIGIQRQRRTGLLRVPTSGPPQLTLVAGLAAALVVAVVGYNLLPGQSGPGTPAATATAATATAVPTPRATAAYVRDILTGERYRFQPVQGVPSFTVVATGPTGWTGYPDWAMAGPAPVKASAPGGISIAFLLAGGVHSDPCHWDTRGNGDETQPGDVEIGPGVEDLVAALRANTFYTSTAPAPVTIDDYAGQELELQLPDDPFTDCDVATGDSEGHAFVFGGVAGLFAQGPANRWHLYVLDVDGTRLIAAVLSYAGTPQADLDLARNVIETLDINP